MHANSGLHSIGNIKYQENGQALGKLQEFHALLRAYANFKAKSRCIINVNVKKKVATNY